jgi:hypothetical protein
MATNAQTMTLPVTERALIARINRKFAADKSAAGFGKRLYRSRPGSRLSANVGRYYVIQSNTVKDCGFNLERMAREMGLMHPYEQIVGVG